jgi:hypothetical protein
MAVPRSGLTNEGALYELLARGNKDMYFFTNEKVAINPFDNGYKQIPAQVHELRRIPPLNGSDFGRTVEFEFDVAGDIFSEPTLLIDLPSWIPPPIAAQNPTSVITDSSGVSYGYTNGIAYFLFSKIQIYQDQILLQEFSGDALFGSTRSRGSLNSAFLDNAITGTHDGSALAIARNATPGRLRLPIPLLGCQELDDGGFPSLSTRQQSLKLRLTLRKLEELVEASDGRAKPVPWARTDFQITESRGAVPKPFTTQVRTAIGTPTMLLESRHTYVDPDTRERMIKSSLEVPYSRLYENTFTFGSKDYEPLSRAAIASATRRLDATHPAGRMLFWFHSQEKLRANQYAKYVADISGGEYYNNISMYIAGRDRETLFPPRLWNRLENLAKEERDPGQGIGVMNWELGELRGRRAPFARQPEGSINFSTADRPTLYIDLADIPIDVVTGQKNTQMTAVIDSWAMALFERERGGLKYAN